MEIVKNIDSLPLMDITKEQIKSGKDLTEPIIRAGSDSWDNFIDEIRNLTEYGYITLNDDEQEIINGDMGSKALYEGNEVLLELPLLEHQDVISNTSLFTVYIKENNQVKKVNFVSENDLDDDEHGIVVNEMFFLKENNLLLENINNDYCYEQSLKKHNGVKSVYMSSDIVKCRRYGSNLVKESFFSDNFSSEKENLLDKLKSITQTKNKIKLIKLYETFKSINWDSLDSKVDYELSKFLNEFNYEKIVLNKLSKCDLTNNDLLKIKLIGNGSKEYNNFMENLSNEIKDNYVAPKKPIEDNNEIFPEFVDNYSIVQEKRKKKKYKHRVFYPYGVFPYYGNEDNNTSDVGSMDSGSDGGGGGE